jgi:hypothetical protein
MLPDLDPIALACRLKSLQSVTSKISKADMHTAITLAACTALILTLAACDQKPAEASPAANTPAAGQAVVAFTPTPDLGKDIAALPRLVGTTRAIAAINADLDTLDAAARESAASCDNPDGGYSRWITQPMTGPAFVTYAISEEYNCGGPYPSTGQTTVTYDLASGRRLDWSDVLKAMNANNGDTEGMPAGSVPIVYSPALAAWYVRTIKAQIAGQDGGSEWMDQCAPVFDAEEFSTNGFRLSVDAEAGGLTVSPELPHVVQACGDAAIMDAPAMRANGVDARLIEALATAHAAGNWAPKE